MKHQKLQYRLCYANSFGAQFHLLRDMLLAWLEHTVAARSSRAQDAQERKARLFYEAGISARTLLAWAGVVRRRKRTCAAVAQVVYLREKVGS